MSSIDLGRELTVRAIAHGLSRRFSDDADRADVIDHALRLAALFDRAHAEHIAAAGVALFYAAGGCTDALDPIHARIAGLQPEEAIVHD